MYIVFSCFLMALLALNIFAFKKLSVTFWCWPNVLISVHMWLSVNTYRAKFFPSEVKNTYYSGFYLNQSFLGFLTKKFYKSFVLFAYLFFEVVICSIFKLSQK